MQGQEREWMNGEGVHEVRVVGCSLQGKQYISGEMATVRKRMSTHCVVNRRED